MKCLIKKQMAFLSDLVEKFGDTIQFVSYSDLASLYNVSYESIRNYMIALEKLGYLTIEKRSPKKFVFHINKEKVNELFG